MLWLSCRHMACRLDNRLPPTGHHLPDTMDVLNGVTDFSPELLLVKHNLKEKERLHNRDLPLHLCSIAGSPGACWDLLSKDQSSICRHSDKLYQLKSRQNELFCWKEAFTLTSSKGKRSWKIRLILAPPDSSAVSTWSPDPSMHFSKSTPNCWTILKVALGV